MGISVAGVGSGLTARGSFGAANGLERDERPAFLIEHDHSAVLEAAAAGFRKLEPGAVTLRIFGYAREGLGCWLGATRRENHGIALRTGDGDDPRLDGLSWKAPQELRAGFCAAFEIGKALHR